MWSLASHGGMDNSFHLVVHQLHTLEKDKGRRCTGQFSRFLGGLAWEQD